VLNELGDVTSDAALYLPFAMHPLLQPAVVALFVVGAVVSEMTGVIAVQIGASRRYDGPMGKSDRALAMSILAITLACGLPATPARGLFILFTLLLLPTIWRRAARALAEISTCPSN
jgi:CDP-diacylglycerol--glycerol-3-phosphate 3-phosphatidyltransferase